MSFLHMSVSGALIIVLVALLRAVFIHKLPKQTFSALWGLALLRLLLPISLPSRFSVYSLLSGLKPAAAQPNYAYTKVYAPANLLRGAAESYAPKAPQAAPAGVETGDILGAVWLCGAVLCALFFILVYLKSRREFKASLPAESFAGRYMSGKRIFRRIELRVSDKISAPLTYGVFRPVILMPKSTDWSDTETVKYIIEHELVHIRRFDAVKKLVLTATLCLHWFNPAVWLMYVLANRDIELSCDEAVVRSFGENTKSAYAMTLIRMEEVRSGIYTPGNNFSKNSVEERIIAIMKLRKPTFAAMLAAVCLILGITAAFATSAEPREESNIKAVTEDITMLVHTDVNGTDYISTDGGKTFERLDDAKLAELVTGSDVEWWTYDEYAAWLENEKEELQDIIGSKGWTQTEGWFEWTQSKVDETIAMYEDILEDIKNGMLISKSVDGDKNIVLAMSVNGVDTRYDADTFAEYEPFGLKWDSEKKALYYKGRRVRYFFDGAYVGNGGWTSKTEYTAPELEGEVDVYTVREKTENADGSFDPMGALIRLETYSEEEFASRDLSPATLEAITSGFAATETLLDGYAPFGLSYEYNAVTGELNMNWNGLKVRSVYDGESGVWISNSMNETRLGEDAVDLETVYKNGEMSGFKTVQRREFSEVTLFCVTDRDAADEGTPLPEMFDEYKKYGVSYEEKQTPDGMERNLYYNGELVSKFADNKPDGGVFTFSSTQSGGISLRTVYDESGKLTGVETV